MSQVQSAALDVETAVADRYSSGAQACESALCCAVSYDPKLLEVVPTEVIERDYGCGDPTQHIQAGETVLDLGSGSGKACFIASQVVGPTGRVIGIDMNDDMLALARRAAPIVAEGVGYSNVDFRKAKIQDLALDLEAVDQHLAKRPVTSHSDLAALESHIQRLRADHPVVPDGSVDVVVSNCVLNLVRPEHKQELFREIFRVLERGGRAVVSDIVCDEDVPAHLQADPHLWSGCISGAFREDRFLEAFEEAGFYGVELLDRQSQPWQTVEGIEFRSVTVVAYRGKEGPCLDRKQAVVYRGPFREVRDDDGHVLRRGTRTAVCDKTYRIYQKAPYRDHFYFVEPRVEVPLDTAPDFPCSVEPLVRDPRETKGEHYDRTDLTGASPCGPSTDCC